MAHTNNLLLVEHMHGEILPLLYLKNDVLGGGVIVTPLLNIAQLPLCRARLVEWLNCPEGDIQLIPVVLNHLS